MLANPVNGNLALKIQLEKPLPAPALMFPLVLWSLFGVSWEVETSVDDVVVTTFTVGSVVEMGELKLVAVVPDEKLNDGEFELTMVELLEVELSNVVLVG